ncbi:MAG: filamentous hemagglutinin N-terminal domain-containing protein [Gammaproteobacteria bacterium]|nr:filamentous hemagglutinin N-terminal domain-containing protein [Gammaproteobacteria bacterium]
MGRFVRNIALLWLGLGHAAFVVADVVVDDSLGTARQVLTGPDYQIDANMGQQQGVNLFHSFESFNLLSSESANFSGPAEIGNIFSRVTGGSSSSINGVLGSDIAGANLYFLNPNGIVFGDSASLNLSGSFYASTADYIDFQDGARFAVANYTASDVTLSASPISAFGFLDNSLATIQLNQSELAVNDGETIGFYAGDISIAGDSRDALTGYMDNLLVSDGRIELVSLASSGEVNVEGANPVIDSGTSRGNISLTESAGINVEGDPGGTVVIRGGQLLVRESVIHAANIGTTVHAGNAVDIELTGAMTVEATTVNDAGVGASNFSTGQSGDINIEASALNIVRTSGVYFPAIQSYQFGDGTTGDIRIDADSIYLRSAQIDSTVSNQGDVYGSSGNIFITADTIELDGSEDGTYISTNSANYGNAGNITINANELIATGNDVYSDFIGITTQVNSSGRGSASSGDLNINVANIALYNSAQINAARRAGGGTSGDITVNSDSILIEGRNTAYQPAGIFTTIESSVTSGDGGHININTRELTMNEYGQINSFVNWAPVLNTIRGGDINITADTINVNTASAIYASTFGHGRSGDININTRRLDLTGSDLVDYFGRQTGMYAFTGTGLADAGNVTVSASEAISIKDGAQVALDTYGSGNGGILTFDAPQITISGWNEARNIASSVSAGVRNFGYPAPGTGGTLNFIGGNVDVLDRAMVTVQTYMDGDAGVINIDADNFTMSDATLLATSFSAGDAGSINVVADNITMNNASVIKSSTTGTGTAGNISISGGNLTITGSDVLADHQQQQTGLYSNAGVNSSQAGSISVNLDGDLLIENQAQVLAETEGAAEGGNINLAARNIMLRDEVFISAESTGVGRAGDVTLNAAVALRIDDSEIKTETTQADGGNINLLATDLMTIKDSIISTSVQGGAGNGGNIFIDPQLLLIDKSQIIANAFSGAGGNITIQAVNMLISEDSMINASSQLGIDGELAFNSLNDNVGGQIEKLSTPAADSSVNFKQNCAASKSIYSSFIVSGVKRDIQEHTGLWISDFSQYKQGDKSARLGLNQNKGCS